MVLQPEACSRSDLSPKSLGPSSGQPSRTRFTAGYIGAIGRRQHPLLRDKPEEGTDVCPALYIGVFGGVGRKMRGGESSLEQCLYSGRTMKKKPLPAAPRSGDPDAPGASHPHREGNHAVRSAKLLGSSSHIPLRFGKPAVAQPASLHPSIPHPSISPQTRGLTLQGHPQPSAVILQLLQCLVAGPHTMGLPSQEPQETVNFSCFKVFFSFSRGQQIPIKL